MKLLFVIDSFGSGGAQRQMVQLAVGLAEAGHELEFFIYVPSHDHFRRVVEDADILVHEYVKSSRYSLGIVPRLARVMRDGAFDLVLAYLTTPGVYAELAARLNRLHGVRSWSPSAVRCSMCVPRRACCWARITSPTGW
jgi:hypothetical protein